MMSNGRELVEQAQQLLRDALMELEENDVRRIVRGSEKRLDEALYMLEEDFDEGEE